MFSGIWGSTGVGACLRIGADKRLPSTGKADMAEQTDKRSVTREGAEEPSSLDALSRTLEELEARLSRMRDAKAARAPSPGSVSLAQAAAPIPRASLADTVSEITMRQKSLQDEAASAGQSGKAVSAPVTPSAKAPQRPAQENPDADRRQAAFSDVTHQLERLRTELQQDMARSLEPRLEEISTAFNDLRQMIAERASAEQIGAEITRVDDGLLRMADNGADQGTIRSLRDELQAMRELVGTMAREETLEAVGRRWDAFETALSGRAEDDTRTKRDIKDELERLRVSLGSLASEEQVKAVERRWDEFEKSYLAAPAETDRPDLSALLKHEMNSLREKLETLASEQSVRAFDERWGVMEERFASREIEGKMEAMAGRLEQLEASLARLPETLAIAPLEQRVHALALGIESLAKQQQEEAELDHFGVLEERLDEISRAIVAATTRSQTIDMSPVERIEARLQTLTARVDSIADDADGEALSARIAELADRIETLSNEEGVRELAERIDRFSAQLATLGGEGTALDVAAVESRLQSLAARLEEQSASRVDETMVRTLESQIARLSAMIAENGVPATIANPELEQRLAAIERRLDDNQEAVMAAARQAADEAIRQVLASGDLHQGEHVARLSEDLRALDKLSRDTGSRSQEFFETVHGTLLKLVDRIGRIEGEMKASRPDDGTSSDDRQMASALPAAAAVAGTPVVQSTGGLKAVLARTLKGRKLTTAKAEAGSRPARWDDPELALADPDDGSVDVQETVTAPSLDAADIFDTHEANRPLAIGSGTPDIAALLERVRAQQAGQGRDSEQGGKADFIAAARRAAMAAAAEAETLRSDEPDTDGKVSLTELVSRRRKPIIMAIGAVLLALMALPLGQALMASRDDNAGASAPAAGPVAELAAPAQPEPAPIDVPPALPAEPAEPAQPPEAEAAAVLPPIPEASRSEVSAPLAGPVGSFEPASSPVPGAGAGEARATVPSAMEPSGSEAAASSAAPAVVVGEAPPEGLGTEAFVAAVRAGDPKALFETGLRLMEGAQGAPQPEQAATWFARSAEKGFAPAQYSLGTLYEKGNGVTRDTAVARDWYVKAAEQGNVRAMHNLAVLFATGVDGKSDPVLAARWFREAADHGMTDSQYNLGILYARGAGVEQDLTESYKWFSIVAAAGDADAGTKRDEVAKSLNESQLEEAKAKVASFRPAVRDETANTVDVPAEWSSDVDTTLQTSSVDMQRAIRNIQAILIKLGYDPGTPDGIAGTKTTEAIRSFQQSAGLDATGRIDEALIRALLERKDT
jgi:localization factor PodJL